MTVYDKLAILKPEKAGMGPLSRIWAELAYACGLSAVREGKFDKVIDQALDYVLDARQRNGAVTKQTAAEAEKMLLPLSKEAKSYTAHCVGHAHIDMNWMWGYNETAAVTVDTFRTVLDLMNEFPGFTFAQSQASTYRIIEENVPEMLEEIKRRVHEGRWEVSASTWVENDKNMPSGESLARHILYTKRYLSKLLDIDPRTLVLDFEPDTFGHNMSVPEVCVRGGVKYYYHCRGREDSPCAYRWRSEAGCELLVYNEPHWYNTEIDPGLFADYPQLCAGIFSRDFLVGYGIGDHGGGPTRRDLDRLIEIGSWPVMPRVEFSTYARFFEALEKSRDKLPVYTGELNCTFTGCYTSQSRIKMANRAAEDRMYEAEFLASLSGALAGDADRKNVLAEAWKNILFNQFHDILPGSGTVETREYAMGRFQSAMAGIQSSAGSAMRAVAAAVDTGALIFPEETDSNAYGGGAGFGVGQDGGFRLPMAERGGGKNRVFHLFNPIAQPFDGVCELTVWDWPCDAARACFRNLDGQMAPCQLVGEGKRYWGHAYKTFALRLQVPALGYTTYTLSEASIGEGDLSAHSTDRVDRFGDDEITLENEYLKAVFDCRGELVNLLDKASGEDLIRFGYAAFHFILENTVHGMTSWRVGETMSDENLSRNCPVTVRKEPSGPVRQAVTFECPFGNRSQLRYTARLDAGSRYLQYAVHVDFQETGDRKHTPQLRFCAEPSPYYHEFDWEKLGPYLYAVPFGVIRRSAAEHDVPACTAMALPSPANPLAPMLVLLADSKYGFRGDSKGLSVNLIRGSSDPDPYPEYGIHDFSLALGICPEGTGDKLLDMAERFVHPPCACSARPGEGSLPLEKSLLGLEGARLSAVKTAEDGRGIVLRVYDASGQGGLVKVLFGFEVGEVHFADLNETPGEKLDLQDGTVSFDIGSREIKTLLIRY